MNTWKLSINPDSKKGFNAFKRCQEKSLLGLGWHHAYLLGKPANLLEAKKLVKDKWKKWPYQLQYFLEDMEVNDHVWIHKNGKYYLCKPTDNHVLYGDAIDPDYASYDLGHARKATWVMVPDKFVTGSIQRGVIAQRTIQKIVITDKEAEFNNYIFTRLQQNPNWEPVIDMDELKKSLVKISAQELFSLLSPDDLEDVISAYLQENGWTLIKSTCFRSKPKFEFSMLNKRGEVAHIQVKSGKSPNPLEPENYKDYANNQNLIYLFSTNRHPYPGNGVQNVHTIEQGSLFKWVLSNLWAITLPLKCRLWIFINEKKC